MKTAIESRAFVLRRCSIGAAISAFLALAACGGGGGGDEAPATAPASQAALFDADGQPSAASRQRPTGAPATKSGLYATPAQYRWEALMVEPYTILVDADEAAPADIVRAALDNRAWRGAAPGFAYYVQGSSARSAAALADALTEAGLGPVFLVAGGG